MHSLLAILAILAAGAFLVYRARRAGSRTPKVPEPAQDLKAAAQRFGFRPHANQHPADGVDDPRVTGAALLVMVAATDGGISKAERDEILMQLRSVFDLRTRDAEELYLFSCWLANQSSNPEDMICRVIKRTVALGGRDTLPDMIQMVRAVGNADTGTLTDDTQQVIESLKQMST